MLTVTTVDGRVDHFSLHEYQAARLIFKKMPRVHDIECYCCKPKLKKNQISLNNKALDPNGQTSTRNYSDPHSPLKTYAQGICLFDITILPCLFEP